MFYNMIILELVIAHQIFTSAKQISKLSSTASCFYDGPVEGVYIRLCDEDLGFTTKRAKIVRNDFLSGNEHWSKNQYTMNIVVSIFN